MIVGIHTRSSASRLATVAIAASLLHRTPLVAAEMDVALVADAPTFAYLHGFASPIGVVQLAVDHLLADNLGRWAIGPPSNCRVPKYVYTLSLDPKNPKNVIWRSGLGEIDVELIVDDNATKASAAGRFIADGCGDIHRLRRGNFRASFGAHAVRSAFPSSHRSLGRL